MEGRLYISLYKLFKFSREQTKQYYSDGPKMATQGLIKPKSIPGLLSHWGNQD
jgi:hypothetical protein